MSPSFPSIRDVIDAVDEFYGDERADGFHLTDFLCARAGCCRATRWYPSFDKQIDLVDVHEVLTAGANEVFLNFSHHKLRLANGRLRHPHARAKAAEALGIGR